MAGFIASPNTIRVLIHWNIHGRPQLNVLHAEYLLAGPLSPTIAQNIWNTVSASLSSTTYNSLLATSTQLAAIGVLDLRSPSLPEIKSTGTAVPGTGAGNPVPDASSAVLTLRTALTGRAHRGRIYTLGWIATTVDPAGLIVAGAPPVAIAWYQSVQNAMAAQSANLAIRSTAKPDRPAHDGSTLPSKPYEITRVTSIESRDLIWDTNRRRTDQLRR